MTDLSVVQDAQRQTKALLQLCKRLEHAWTLADILGAVAPTVKQELGYGHVWLDLVNERPGYLTVLQLQSHDESFDSMHALAHSLDIPIAGDPMLEEIAAAEHIVVVEDARTDPRTNKEVVAALQNRTIINVPLLLAGNRVGMVGMGTFGDAEGVRPPEPWQLEFMQAFAGHVAVALDRVRFLEAQKRTEDALHQEKERLQVTLHAISDAVISTNAQGLVLYLNPAAEQLSGWTQAQAQGQPYQQVFRWQSQVEQPAVADLVAQALAEVRTLRFPQLTLEHRVAGSFLVEAAVSPIRDVQGAVQGAVLVFRDVTEQRRLSQEMAYQATHDELTGLGNRRAFETALGHCFAQVQESGVSHVVCYLDLDDFKVINDTCGHAAGDELLRQSARLLSQGLRPQDHLCRLGGDEFGMVLSGQTLAQALVVAERLQQRLAAERFVWQGQSFSVGVSIGMVQLDARSESVGALLQAADSACYVAKDAGRGRIHIYTNDDPALAQRYGVMEWVSRIEDALREDRFVLYAQPIVPILPAGVGADGGLYCEFLLRMRDGQGGLVLPGQFMPAVERYHLAARVDRWVLSHALAWMVPHQERIGHCSINLSGQSLGDPMFMTYVLDTLAATPMPCHKLCFEITETAAISNLHTAKHFIDTLRKMGCQLSLDDFGSGLSSFAYLRNLPVDVLKIDGQFVRDVVADPVSLAMVKSIHEIGCLMGKKTVAEFAETPAILEVLRGLGVHYAQGYAVGYPVPLDQLLQSPVQAMAAPL